MHPDSMFRLFKSTSRILSLITKMCLVPFLRSPMTWISKSKILFTAFPTNTCKEISIVNSSLHLKLSLLTISLLYFLVFLPICLSLPFTCLLWVSPASSTVPPILKNAVTKWMLMLPKSQVPLVPNLPQKYIYNRFLVYMHAIWFIISTVFSVAK